MANNIYIGNRYVPVFANPVEWDNLREYEPLTIVTYQGTSYTSKKRVPVGTALSNTDYWVVTGNYNAQVEDYRQAVVELDGEVDALTRNVNERFSALGNRVTDTENGITSLEHINYYKDKKILILGDSLSDEAYGPSAPNWVTFFRTNVVACGGTVTNFSNAGRSLSAVRTDNLIAHLSEIPSGSYTDIIVFLGINDWASSASATQISDALNALKAWVEQTHPDATVYYMSPIKAADTYNPSIPIDYYRGVLYKHIMRYGWYHIDTFAEAPNYNGSIPFNANRYTLDGLHFKPAYAPYFASYMFERIKTRCSTFNTGFVTDITLTANTGFSAICYYHSDGTVNLYVNCGSFTPSSAATEVCTVPSWLIPILPVSCEGYSIANGKKDYIGGYIRNDNGKMYAVVNEVGYAHSPADITFHYYVNPMFRPNV